MSNQMYRYQTPVALPHLDIPASSWLHFRPGAEARPGDVVFALVQGTVTVGTMEQATDGEVVFRDGASGESTPIRRPGDLRSFGVVVRVTSDFA